ncbi:MAG TPA: PDZ domain-containing protein [Candidatus Nanoarchaeia archaeon]|nr:PDZ domain-containing protein [Candidatus Nanoarchaeia archaeon]
MKSKYLTMKVWVLIIALVFALLAINPRPWATGIEVKSVEDGSFEQQQGIKVGSKLLTINGEDIDSLSKFASIKKGLEAPPKSITVKTSTEEVSYNITDDIGFIVNNNLSIINVKRGSLVDVGSTLVSVNDVEFSTIDQYNDFLKEFLPKKKLSISTSDGNFVYLTPGDPKITVGEAAKTNIKKGLDLSGGTRVLLKPISEQEITEPQVNDLIAVLENRLNVYGLADLKIRSARDLEGGRFIIIEMAGVTKDEVSTLIGQQGIFEAKIGDELVFEGGKGDVPFVCRDDAKCSGIVPPCTSAGNNQFQCQFEFAIKLSAEAATRHATVTDKLAVNGSYLEKPIDFYLDGQLVNSLRISSNLKGAETTDIAISGPGFGIDEASAYEDALREMKQLQTILITGSLPLKIEIVKLDTISPVLGQTFIKNTFIVAIVAIIGVSLIIFLKYRRIKLTIPIMLTVFSEVFITLGVAAFARQFWSIDVAAIAGIIAAVGTGVNDQIIITDEILRKEQEYVLSWKEKVKRAFSIVMAAFFTIVAAMLPLLFAGAGLIRGFAISTIVGAMVGVFITRPAFSSIVEHLVEDENKTQ